MRESGQGRYSPRQIEKYRRQKYILQLEKITKNLFRMFRDRRTDARTLRKKIKELIRRLDELEEIRLDSEYLRQSEAYVRRLAAEIGDEEFDDRRLESIREPEMSNLNRLQKMKNRSGYRKAKHRQKLLREGWE